LVQRVGEVGIGAFLAVERHGVELVVGTIDALHAGAGEQVLQFHLDDGSVAARFREFGLLHHHRVFADHDDVAGAEFHCGFHGYVSCGES